MDSVDIKLKGGGRECAYEVEVVGVEEKLGEGMGMG